MVDQSRPREESSTADAATLREDPGTLFTSLCTLAVGISAAVASLLRISGWKAAVGFDAWAYVAWGQALARGEAPLYYKGGTTPKPLAMFLMAVFSPLGGRVAALASIAIGFGLVVGGLFVAGRRYGGNVAGAFAGVLLFLAASFSEMVEPSDVLTAGLICAAVGARGRIRIGFLVLAGLLRPEPWVLAAAAGWLFVQGPVWRRAVTAVLCGAAPIVVWLTTDLVLTGHPFATYRWIVWARTDRLGESVAAPRNDLSDALGDLASALAPNALAIAVVVLGVAGLWSITRREPPGRADPAERDPFPMLVAVLGASTLGVLVWSGANVYVRYVVPAISTMLALGAAVLIGRWLPLKLPIVIASVLAVGGFAAAIWPPALVARERATAVTERVEGSLPALRALTRCGRVALAGNFRVREYIPFIAGIGELPPAYFGVLVDTRVHGEDTERFGSVVRVHHQASTLPEWDRRYATELGRVAVRDDCRLPDDVAGLEPVGGRRP